MRKAEWAGEESCERRLLIPAAGIAAGIGGLAGPASPEALSEWAESVAALVRAHSGVPLASLTLSEVAQPALDGCPHGIYFIWIRDQLTYIGSCKGRSFHERLASHLEGSENGWFNSCVRAMVRSGQRPEWATAAMAVADLLVHGSVAFLPVGSFAISSKDQRRALVQLENRLRMVLSPLNRARGAASTDQIEATLDRHDEFAESLTALAEAEDDLDLLDESDAPEQASGEVLFVKCAATWLRAQSDADKQASVLGNWKISDARAKGVRVVAGVVAGQVVAAWQVAEPRPVGEGRIRFAAVRQLADLESLASLIAGREKGWTWKYAAP